jgi:cytidyltransferase-like protein
MTNTNITSNTNIKINTNQNTTNRNKSNQTKVLVFGSFDHLHPGHLHFLKSAKKLGTHLTVVVARDNTIEQVKNHKPKYSENERLQHIKETNIPDQTILGQELKKDKSNKYQIIQTINPDIIALGYDQTHFTKNLKQELKKLNLHPKIITLTPHKPEIYKSSILKNQDNQNLL